MKGFNPGVREITGPMAGAARCYTQQIFSCSASQIDKDTSLSDYRDMLVKPAVHVCVCVTVIADQWIYLT